RFCLLQIGVLLEPGGNRLLKSPRLWRLSQRLPHGAQDLDTPLPGDGLEVNLNEQPLGNPSPGEHKGLKSLLVPRVVHLAIVSEDRDVAAGRVRPTAIMVTE